MTDFIAAELRCRFPALYPPPSPPTPRLDSTGIVLGKANGKPVPLPWKVRNSHIFAIGLTGVGKTRLMLCYARQLLSRGEGFMFVDPHGGHNDSAYRAMARMAANSGRRVHIIDLNCAHVRGFNPLHRPEGYDSSVIVGNVMDAVSAVWSDEPLYTKPTLERNMRIGLTALVELNLTLCDLLPFFDRDDAWGLRQRALNELTDPVVLYEIEQLHRLSQERARWRDYHQEVIGPANRLARLIVPRALRAMLGQTEDCLDIQAAMDDGDIILVNLSGGAQAYESEADLLGRLIVRMCLFHAKRRANTRPFTLMLDEAHRFVSGDLPVLLAEVRKYGLSIFASIQWLNQVAAVDENVLAAFINGTGTKIAMRLPDAEEAEKLARSNVPLNLERLVAVLNKPTVVAYQLRHFRNESDSTQQSTTLGTSETESETVGISETEGHSRAYAEQESHSVTEGTSNSRTHGHTKTQGGSRAKNTSHTNSRADNQSSATGTSSLSSKGSMKGAGNTEGQVVWTSQGVFGQEERPSSRESRGSSFNSAESNSNAKGHNSTSSKGATRGAADTSGENSGVNWSTADNNAVTEGTNRAVTTGRATTITDTESYALTRSYSRNRATTQSEAETRGTGHSRGFSEGLEPIMQVLPTAVHSLQNELYAAGRLLRELPTATAYINYIGPNGLVATLFRVPPVFTPHITNEAFSALRDGILVKNGAIPVERALQLANTRLEQPSEYKKSTTKPARPKPLPPDESALPSESF